MTLQVLANLGELLGPLIADREVAALWLAGGAGFSELDAVDQQRLIFFESLGPREAMRAAWQSSRAAYDERFQELMDRYVGPADAAGLLRP